MDIEQALSQAELLIRQNQTSQARAILGEILRENPQNEEAWILSAQVSDKPQQVLYCLRQAIKINPGSSRARLLLDRLQSAAKPGGSSFLIPTRTAAFAGYPTAPGTAPGSCRAAARSAARFHNFLFNSRRKCHGTEESATAVPAMVPGKPDRPRAWPRRWLHQTPNAMVAKNLHDRRQPCLLAPWMTVQNADNTPRTFSGLDVLLGPIFSPLGVDVGIAGLALLASLALPLLMFFRFRSAATQKWGERATIALAPLASVLCLDMISFYYAGLTNNVELRLGHLGCLRVLFAGWPERLDQCMPAGKHRADGIIGCAGWPGFHLAV